MKTKTKIKTILKYTYLTLVCALFLFIAYKVLYAAFASTRSSSSFADQFNLESEDDSIEGFHASLYGPVLYPSDFYITVYYENESDRPISYGYFFYIDKYDEENDEWETLEFKPDIATSMDAAVIQPGEKKEQKYYLYVIQDSMPDGKYRIRPEVEGGYLNLEFAISTEAYELDKKARCGN